jgi:uncharacterized protein YdhG (YjbR/CyaY superfamily)
MPAMRSKQAGTVDDYLKMVPEEMRVRSRSLARSLSPRRLGQPPIFKDKGHPLVGFRAAQNHCSFYVMSSSMIPKLARMRDAELKGYKVSRATIHFTPLPNAREAQTGTIGSKTRGTCTWIQGLGAHLKMERGGEGFWTPALLLS